MNAKVTTDNEAIIQALQRRLNEDKDYDGFACRECQFKGHGFTVLPESMMKRYESSRDCPDEIYWVVRTYDENAPELQDEDGCIIDDYPEWSYETSEFLCEGHAPDCNGVCDYNLLTILKNQ
mgnify:FL=1